jgi:dihydroflavonol-4-reductase
LPPYERSKAEGDRLVLAAVEAGMDIVTITPTAVLGPCDFRPSYIGQAIWMLAHGRIPALVNGGYDWVDVRDVVEGSIAAELAAPTGRRYLLGGHWHPVREVASLIAGCSGVHAPRFTVPLELAEFAEPLMASLAKINGSEPLYTRAMLHALHSNHTMSWQRAARELGYNPRPLKETIADTLRWFAENPQFVP